METALLQTISLPEKHHRLTKAHLWNVIQYCSLLEHFSVFIVCIDGNKTKMIPKYFDISLFLVLVFNWSFISQDSLVLFQCLVMFVTPYIDSLCLNADYKDLRNWRHIKPPSSVCRKTFTTYTTTKHTEQTYCGQTGS